MKRKGSAMRVARVAVVLWTACLLSRAEEAIPVSHVLPGDAAAALYVADVAAFKKALLDTDFGRAWSEPELQVCLQPAIQTFLTEYPKLQKAQPVLPNLDELAKLLSGDIGITVSLPRPPQAEPVVCAAISVGDAKALDKLLFVFVEGQPVKAGKVYQMGDEGAGFVFEKELLLFSSDPAALKKMRERLSDGGKRGDSLAQSGLAALDGLLDPGPVSLVVNLKVLMKQLVAEARDPVFRDFMARWGVLDLEYAGLCCGTRNGTLALDIGAKLSGPPKGLWADIAGREPLPAAALDNVPAGTRFCNAARYDLHQFLQTIRACLDPQSIQALDQALAQAKEVVGVDLEKDLLASLGDTWVLHEVGEKRLFGMFNSVALTVSLKDPDLFVRSLDKLLAAAKTALEAQAQGPAGEVFGLLQLRETQVGQTKVQYLNLPLWPLSPCMAVQGRRLLITLSVPAMRAALHPPAGPGLAAAPEFKAAMERAMGAPLNLQALPAQFNYSNPDKNGAVLGPAPDLAKLLADAARMGLRASGRRRNLDLPPLEGPTLEKLLIQSLDKLQLELFPGDSVFQKHLKPCASVLLPRPSGFVIRCDVGLPAWGDASEMMAINNIPIIAAIAIPSLLGARKASNETAAIQNLKTLAVCQEIYRKQVHDGGVVKKYAQAIKGDGKTDGPAGYGLYQGKKREGNFDGAAQTGALNDIALANAEWTPGGNPTPKAGYLFRAFTGAVRDGKFESYVANGHMTGGYAFAAYPAVYGTTGSTTFLMDAAGTVYSKDLGPNTRELVEKMEGYAIDQTWVAVD